VGEVVCVLGAVVFWQGVRARMRTRYCGVYAAVSRVTPLSGVWAGLPKLVLAG